MIRYYQFENMPYSFSRFIRLERVKKTGFNSCFMKLQGGREKSVQIIAYCLMPTHLHLVLKQLKEDGIPIFMSNILNSYARYFNTKHKRKGPLWEGRYKKIIVKTDEYLLQLTRYIHLNPVTAFLVNKPDEWQFSSYQGYLQDIDKDELVCEYEDFLSINPVSYRRFVKDRISFQRDLARLKKLFLE